MRNCHITLLEEKSWWKLGKCEWRAEYMLMGIKLREAEEKAKKEGLAEGLAEGRAEGRAEGHAEGMTESKTETAKRLAQMGLTIDQIAKAVDASKEDVQEWITMPLR